MTITCNVCGQQLAVVGDPVTLVGLALAEPHVCHPRPQ